MSRWLAAAVRRTPGAVALECGAERMTYRELEARVAITAGRLAEVGVGGNDRVTLRTPADLDTIVLFHALWRLGACAVPLNLRLSAAEAAAQRDRVAPRLHLEEAAPWTAAGGPGHSLPGAVAVTGTEPEGDPQRPAAILFTSGTSGVPKPAVLTAANLDASARASRACLVTGPDDRWLCCLPLFHVGGLSILVRAACDGAAVIVQRGFDSGAVSRAIDEARVTRVSLVPTTLKRLLDARDDRPPPETLRLVLLGGAAASPKLLRRAAAAGFPVRASYGLTETASQIATAGAGDPADGAVGRALPGSEVRIADPGGGPVAPGAEGEIQVRGPTVFQGYLGDEPATARAFAGGWFRTGDIGRIEADGRLRVLDRRSDLIVSGGENVYPAEVEAALLTHPGVSEVAVWRRPDDDLGHRVVAWVVPDGSAAPSPESLRRHCEATLAGYKKPREFCLVAELPRNAMGKVVRAGLS